MGILLKETVISLSDNLINTFNNYSNLYSQPDSDKEKIKEIVKSRASASYDIINNYTVLYPGLEILSQLKQKTEDILNIINERD